MWGRCCLDYEAVCEEKTGNWSLGQIENATDIILKRQSIYFGNVFLKERTTYNHIDEIYFGRQPFRNGSKIYVIEECYNMISFCSDQYQTTQPLYDKCQVSSDDDLLSKIPVSTSETVYRNIYCAICNGLDIYRDEYFPWNIEYLCDNNTATIQSNVLPNVNITEQFNCQFVYAPPQSGPELHDFRCEKFIEKCNSSFERTSEIYRACNRYMADAFVGRVRYKNYHCAMCNKGRNSKPRCIGLYSDMNPFVKFTDGFQIKLPDFSKLITVFISSSQTDEDAQNHCDEGEIKSGELCVPDDRSTQLSQLLPGNETLFYIYLRAETYVNATTAGTKRHLMKRLLSLTIIDSIDEKCEKLSLTSKSSLFKNTSLDTFQLCFVVKANANKSLPNLGIRKMTETLELLIKTICRADFCMSPIIYKVLNYLEIDFNNRCQIGSAVRYDVSAEIDSLLADETVYLNSKNQTYVITSFPFVYDGVLIHSNSNVTYLKRNMSITICEHVLNNCSKQFISETGFKRFNNDTVYIHKYRLFVRNDRFEYYNNGIVVCSSILKYLETNEGNLAKSVLSLICITISLLSLVCTFSVYCMFPTLRTIGGKSLMNLVVALFFGQLVFELSALPVGYKIPCLIVAVTQHYFFLVSFTWMSILGYDLCSTFTSPAASSSAGRSGRLFILYVVIAWGLPLLVVVPCLFLHFCGNGDYGYGEHYFCWLINTRSILFFFGIPLMVSILVNICFFTRTAVAIFSAAKESNRVRKNDSLELKVVMKMASLMGFTWIFSILSGLISIDVFDYLFIAFNGLQGFYLFLAFVTKKSTYNLFKLRFHSVVDSSSGTQSTN